MKKQLLSFIAIVGLGFAGYSQCTPDPTFTTEAFAISPDTVTNLKCITLNQSHQEVMQFKLPKKVGDLEPTHPLAALDVDSVKLVGLNVVGSTGLPSGLSFVTDNSRDTWAGDAFGCALLAGTVTDNSLIGVHPVNVDVIAYVVGQSEPRALTGYKITIASSCGTSTGFDEINASSFSLAQNKPNPFNTNSTIEFNSKYSGVYEFTVSNLLGEIVNSQTIFATSGVNIINISSDQLPMGIYTYSLSNGSETATKRMIVAAK